MKLKPIESAPRDGTRVLLAVEEAAGWMFAAGHYKPRRGNWDFPATHWCPIPTLDGEDELEAVTTQAETAGLVAEIKEAWRIINVLHMAQMDQQEVWPKALEWLARNEALAKIRKGAG